MNLSMRWLKDYVQLQNDITPRQYADAMTMSGSKVEGWHCENEEIDKVVVGRVLSVEKHPNADSLFVCQIDVGQGQPLQIVTGATNLAPNQLVPVALDGSTLPGGKKIRKGKLRGEESNGMLCSLEELGLTLHDFPYANPDGIFVLEEECAPGDEICAAIGLDDTSVEFEITSNRPDCLSVLGLARETAVTFGLPFKKPLCQFHSFMCSPVDCEDCSHWNESFTQLAAPKASAGKGNISEHLVVEVQAPDLCPRYTARMVQNVKIGPSPRWMRQRLRASGVRPINNIVDITNFVMLEYGQPMHAFDYRQVKDGKIIVRKANAGEKITTLDSQVRNLTPDMLVIADASGATAVAGVMGGEFSGIADDTTTILFESANFLGSSIRTTSKKLGLRTDSSSRFEKGLDPAACLPALERACQLVQELGIGDIVGGCIDICAPLPSPTPIALESQWQNDFLGLSLTTEQMCETLRSLGFTVEGEMVTPPTFRADVTHKADLAEEIARIHGYDKIPVTTLRGLADGAFTPGQKLERMLSQTLLSLGLYEVVTYSFISPKYYDKINLPAESPLRNSVAISNPLGEDTSILRTTAIPSMLEVLSRNYNNRNPQAALFELATEYFPGQTSSYHKAPDAQEDLPAERRRLIVGMYGEGDYFHLKGIVEMLLERMGVSGWEIAAKTNESVFHPGRCAELTINGQSLGLLGEVHPAICENYSMSTRMLVASLDAELLFNLAGDRQISYKPLPRFPASVRDLALLCDDALPVAKLEQAMRQAAGNLAERIQLFDIYRGSQIPTGKKSVAYSLTLRAADRTLTDQEADGVVEKILRRVGELGAALRS